MEYVLEMKDISKTFSGVKALDNVQLKVRHGEVHALMGENDAGKSTLMKILMGIYTKDEGGEILFDGKPYRAASPKEAMDCGVAMIHQELNPILDMTVFENIFVGRELKKNGMVDTKNRDTGGAAPDCRMWSACLAQSAAAQLDCCPVSVNRDY